MALIIPATNVSLTSSFALNLNDAYTINQGITVSGSGGTSLLAAGTFSSNVTVSVFGNLFAYGTQAIWLQGFNDTVVVGRTGVVQTLLSGANGQDAVYVSGIGTVRNFGLIQSSRDGVHVLSGSAVVYNEGTIDAVRNGITADGITTTVGNTGTIHSGATAVALYNFGSSLDNSGSLSSLDTAVDLNGASSFLRNSGTITTTYTNNLDISAVTLTDGSKVENSGSIASFHTVIFASGGLTLANAGQILATGTGHDAVRAGSGQINNLGDIVGDVRFTSATLAGFVTNSGAIHGEIQFSDAGGVFTDAGGTVTGVIHGGAASDLFNVNSIGLTITDASGLDYDLVNASVDFTLGNGIEALRLFQNAVYGAGNAQNNGIEGNAMANILLGEFGADSVLGYIGADSLFGGADNDSLYGGDEDDQLNGGAQEDQLFGEDGSDALRGQAGNDYMSGGADDDILLGGTGNDSLYGGDGSDVLTGGAGKDLLVGAGDDDTFVFGKGDSGKTASTRDVISGFAVGVDTVDLSRMDANTTNANPNDAFTFIAAGAFTLVAGQLHHVVSGGNILLEGDTNADGLADFQIQLNGIAAIAVGDLVL